MVNMKKPPVPPRPLRGEKGVLTEHDAATLRDMGRASGEKGTFTNQDVKDARTAARTGRSRPTRRR